MLAWLKSLPGQFRLSLGEIWNGMTWKRGAIFLMVTATAAFAMLIVRPNRQMPVEDVASAWNASIGRLGINPIYPPEEDVYVGDIWAVIDGEGDDPILGTSVRLFHIDLSKFVLLDARRRARFAALPGVVEANTTAALGPPPPAENASEAPISLTLAAFPGVTITHYRRAGSTLGMGWFGGSAANNASTVEEIGITEAYTYGLPAVPATRALADWCLAPASSAWCEDGAIRNVMYMMGLPKVAQLTPDGKSYLYGLELRLVSRVYLAKSLTQHNGIGDERGIAAAANPEVATPQTDKNMLAATEPTTSPDARATAVQTQLEATAGSLRGGAVSLVTTDGSDVALKRDYARPVVFGYRAAVIALQKSTPQEYRDDNLHKSRGAELPARADK